MKRFIARAAIALTMASTYVMAQQSETAAAVRVSESIYGEAFTDAAGMQLYLRTARDACTGSCLSEWLPMRAARLAKPRGAWTIVTRPDDSSRQWAFEGKPVYTSVRDLEPGDVNGAGVSGWEPAMAKRDYMPPDVEIRRTDYGETLARASDGRSLYVKMAFVLDVIDVHSRKHGRKMGPEGCVGDCLKAYVPFAAPDGAKQADDWKVVSRPDGTRQWSWKGMPLYTFAGDKKPGDVGGEGDWRVRENFSVQYWEVADLIPGPGGKNALEALVKGE